MKKFCCQANTVMEASAITDLLIKKGYARKGIIANSIEQIYFNYPFSSSKRAISDNLKPGYELVSPGEFVHRVLDSTSLFNYEHGCNPIQRENLDYLKDFLTKLKIK